MSGSKEVYRRVRSPEMMRYGSGLLISRCKRIRLGYERQSTTVRLFESLRHSVHGYSGGDLLYL